MKNRLLSGFAAAAIVCTWVVTDAGAQQAAIRVDASRIENKITPWLYASGIEDVNHEIYGGLYDQRIFGESFEEPSPGVKFTEFSSYGGDWQVKGNTLWAPASGGPKLVFDAVEIGDGWIETEIKFDKHGMGNAGIAIRVTKPGIGADNFNGYEIALQTDGKVVFGKHRMNWRLLKEGHADFDPLAWNTLRVEMNGNQFEIFVNGVSAIVYEDSNPLLGGKAAIRNWNLDAGYRNFKVNNGAETLAATFRNDGKTDVSKQWQPIASQGAKVNFAIDAKDPFNGRQSQMVQLSGPGTAGVSNMSLNGWGIAVREGQMFQGSVYLKGSIKGNIVVALQSEDGSKEYAKTILGKVGNKWGRQEFNLMSSAADPKARLAIYITTPGKVWIDQATLMSTGEDQFKGLPLRADIGQAMVDQGLTFLRYGGSMVNAPEYRWKNMTGPREKRPPYKGWWNPYSTNGFGIIEFMQYADAAGFVPSFAVNIEESPEDMLAMIEYFNGPVTSPWGKKRAEDGHPRPYGFKYLEIGNEEVLFNGDVAQEYDHYIERFNLIYDAIHSQYPEVEFICSAWWRPDSPNIEKVFRAMNGKASYWDYHPWADDLKTGVTVDAELRQMRNMFLAWDPNTTMKCALFEENGNTHNMQRALGHVTLQNAARRHGDFLLSTCAANALEPYKQNDNGWNQGQVFFTPSQVWGMPPFYAQQMASQNHKPLRVFSEAQGELDVTAATDEKRSELVIHVANINDRVIPAAMDIAGFGKPSQVKVITLSGQLPEANTPQQPERIVPQTKVLTQPENLIYEFPPYSYTVMVYSK